MVTDARTLVDFARVEAQNHFFVYNEPITVRALTRAVSDLALNFGEGDSSSKKKPMVFKLNSVFIKKIYSQDLMVLLC